MTPDMKHAVAAEEGRAGSRQSASLVLDPGLGFAEIDRRLTQLGWRLRETSGAAPILAGEPEAAVWRSDGGGSRVGYTFNPVIHLRVLQFSGGDPCRHRFEVSRDLPILTEEAIGLLLDSEEVHQILLAVFAVGELRVLSAIPKLEKLCRHPSAAVSRAAAKIGDELGAAAAQVGANRLAEERARHPGKSAIFPRLGGIETRLQVLRWLARDHDTANAHMLEVLRSALADDDWEVRATAILVAARLRASRLAVDVRRAVLPRTGCEGLDPRDRDMLAAMRKAAVATLTGQEPPAADAEPPDTPSRMRVHLWRCVLGLPVHFTDGVFLFAHAMATPLEDGPEPVSLPNGIVRDGDGYRLRRSRIELAWVPPVAHWLGDESGAETLSPIRCVTPPRGFFIARRPMRVEQVRVVLDEMPAAIDGSPHDAARVTWESARAVCAALGHWEGMDVALPEPDAWEMAVRGPDGRRYPWGNGLRGEAPFPPSPWGVEEAVSSGGEWTNAVAADGARIVCGADARRRAAVRRVTRDAEVRLPIRFTVA